jgi:DNA repair exonuclease SbcCD nuclease subunit
VTTIAHLADLHIGYSHLNQRTSSGQNARQADFARAALVCADKIVETKPDLAIIAGDFLHETNLYPAAMRAAVEFCRRLERASIPLIAIGGNHDEAEAEGRYNALKFLAEQEALDLYLDQDYLDIAGVRLHLVSYRVLSRAERGRLEIKPFTYSDDLPNILVAHGYTPGQGVPEIPIAQETTIPEDWLTNPRFEAALLGHVHHHGEVKEKVFYAGAVERRNFGEVGERPGFWLHEVSKGNILSESVYVDDLGTDLVPRPMYQFELDTDKMTSQQVNTRVLKVIEEPKNKGAMLRVVLQNVSAELDRSRARVQWERAFRKVGGFSFEAVTQTRRITELMDIEFSAPPADITKGFLDFLDLQQFGDPEEKANIQSLAEEVMAEAREKVISQDGGDQ